MDNRHDVNKNNNNRPNEQLSLESILAEYKSEAFIAGDKRTPKNVLEERSRAIVMEVSSGSIASSKADSRDISNASSDLARDDINAPNRRFTKSGAGEGLYSRIRAMAESENKGDQDTYSSPEPRAETRGSDDGGIIQNEPEVTETEARDIFETITGESYNDFLSTGYSKSDRSAPLYNYYGGGLTYDPDAEEEKKASLLSRLKARLAAVRLPGGTRAAVSREGGENPAYADFLKEDSPGDIPGEQEEPNRIIYSSAEEFLDSSAYETSPPVKQEKAEEHAEAFDDLDEYASVAYSESPRTREDIRQKYSSARDRNFLNPLIALLAAIITLRRNRSESEKPVKEKAPPPEEDIPEVPPTKAAKHYASQVMPLKLRGTLAAAVCVLMAYISYGHEIGFPLPDAFSGNIRLVSGICLIMLLSVVMLGLDVFTNGLTALFRLRPRAETLVALSCIASALDATRIMLYSYDSVAYIPYCTVSAVSMAFAILGNRLMCTGLRACFRTAAAGASPQTATGEGGILENGTVLMRTRRGTEGFVRISEEPDCGDSAYSIASPFFIVSSLIMSLLAALNCGMSNFFHILSAIMGTCASFSCLISFSLPFSTAMRRLMQSGAAVAGWFGTSLIGNCKGIVVTDSDIFPPSAISIESTRILEGMFADKVISYTGSLLAASGMGISSAFTELMKRNGYTMYRVEDFSPHEGGGLVARILGEQIYVGSSGFMQLMGIRMPRSLVAKNVIFTAISGTLVGVFHIGYKPLPSVQNSLVALLQSMGNPYFAIRDFNITPQLISEKFKLPAESFEFPSFENRYRLSAAEQESGEPPAAVISRDTLGSMVEAFTRGRRLYLSARLCVALSLFSSIAGMLLMFFLCWAGAFDSASVGNTLSFMLLWLTPVYIITLGLRR